MSNHAISFSEKPTSALPRAFYARPVLSVARDLIGKCLVHVGAEGTTIGRIVETEAYRGPEDKAAHSFGGRRTPRNEAMWGPPGQAYVFLVYGLHHQFNVVTTAEGVPHAVLIRAIEPLQGVELMRMRRKVTSEVQLASGPGKLCQAFGIDRTHDSLSLLRGSRLYLTDGERGRVVRSTRVGVEYAGDWAGKTWRFLEKDNRFVSRKA